MVVKAHKALFISFIFGFTVHSFASLPKCFLGIASRNLYKFKTVTPKLFTARALSSHQKLATSVRTWGALTTTLLSKSKHCLISGGAKIGIPGFSQLLNTIKEEEERSQLAEQFIKKNWKKISDEKLYNLLRRIKNKEKILKKYFMLPDYNSFTTSHLKDNFQHLITRLRTVKPEIRELTLEMIDYQHEQERKGNVVYFHGQNWSWKQYADLYKALYKVDHALQDEYKFLRFTTKHIDTSREKLIAKNGVDACYGARQDLFFTNRSLFANDAGSNAVDLVQSNVKRFNDINMNKIGEIIFMQLGYEKEFDLLQKEHPELLERYNKLHQQASKFGNFLVITMPPKTACKISYSAEIGGYRKGNYNQYEQGWLSYVKKHTIPAYHQYCIVLGPTLLNPENAHKAGITIREYNAADPEIMAERDKVLAEIIELVKNYRKKL